MILKIKGPDNTEAIWHLHFHRQMAESDAERTLKNQPPLPWDVVTLCLVHTGPCILTHLQPRYCINGTVGTSKCSKKDQFVRALGAKQALQRAMRGLPSSTRKALWEAYWLRVRRPKERSEHFRRRVQQISKAA